MAVSATPTIACADVIVASAMVAQTTSHTSISCIVVASVGIALPEMASILCAVVVSKDENGTEIS